MVAQVLLLARLPEISLFRGMVLVRGNSAVSGCFCVSFVRASIGCDGRARGLSGRDGSSGLTKAPSESPELGTLWHPVAIEALLLWPMFASGRIWGTVREVSGVACGIGTMGVSVVIIGSARVACDPCVTGVTGFCAGCDAGLCCAGGVSRCAEHVRDVGGVRDGTDGIAGFVVVVSGLRSSGYWVLFMLFMLKG